MARLRPSSPDSPPSPLRRRKSGVWIAPQPTTTRSLSTRTRPARGGHGLHATGPPALDQDPGGPAAAERGGAGVPGLRHVDLAGVLLGRRRAAEGAHPGADAALGVAEDVVPAPAEGVGPALHDRRVAARQLGRDLSHVQLALHPPEERVERLRRELLEPEALGPELEHRRRRPEAGTGVHGGAAPHRLAERQRDRHVAHRHGLARVAVERGGHLARPRGHLVGREALALLEHHHAHAALRELLGHRGATGAGADHAHVGALDALAGDAAALLDPDLLRHGTCRSRPCRPRRSWPSWPRLRSPAARGRGARSRRRRIRVWSITPSSA